jgi:hypothetical protein
MQPEGDIKMGVTKVRTKSVKYIQRFEQDSLKTLGS